MAVNDYPRARILCPYPTRKTWGSREAKVFENCFLILDNGHNDFGTESLQKL